MFSGLITGEEIDGTVSVADATGGGNMNSTQREVSALLMEMHSSNDKLSYVKYAKNIEIDEIVVVSYFLCDL